MKIISRFVLLALTITTLAACQQSGDGPSKPANTDSTKLSTK